MANFHNNWNVPPAPALNRNPRQQVRVEQLADYVGQRPAQPHQAFDPDQLVVALQGVERAFPAAPPNTPELERPRSISEQLGPMLQYSPRREHLAPPMKRLLVHTDYAAQFVVCDRYQMRPGQNTGFDWLHWSKSKAAEAGTANMLYLTFETTMSDRHFTHPSFTYEVGVQQALLAMAGRSDAPDTFVKVLNDTEPDQLLALATKLHHEPFITKDCVRGAVHTAVVAGIDAQQPNTSAVATQFLDRAHEVVATYLYTNETTVNDRGKFANGVDSLFDAFYKVDDEVLSNCLPDPLIRSQFAGILTGVLLAGVVRYSEHSQERGNIKKQRLMLAVGFVSAAISPAPIAGGIIGGVMTALAEPIADRIFSRKPLKPAVLQIGAAIEDRVRANPGSLVAVEFADQLEKTMRHCGIAY